MTCFPDGDLAAEAGNTREVWVTDVTRWIIAP